MEKNLKLNDIFNGERLYKIPDYQRGYAWEESQLKDFCDDFSMHTDFNYYYGTILLYKGESNRFEIVDGQQRITTLILFISCLIRRMKELGRSEEEIKKLERSYIFSCGAERAPILELQDSDHQFFVDILKNNNVGTEKTPSQSKLKKAKDYLDERLSHCDTYKIDNYINRLNKTNVLVYYIKNEIESAMIFETTNDRGKPLTNLEKTKSFLMYKASELGERDHTTYKEVQKRFVQIYENYKNLENQFKNENNILQYSFIAKEDWRTSNNASDKQEKNGKQRHDKPYQHYMAIMKNTVEEFFKKDDRDGAREYIKGYVNRIQETFESLRNMVQSKSEAFHDILSMRNVANFYPLLIKCWQIDRDKDKNNFENICRLCEIFSFRVYVIADKRSDTAQTQWYDLARDFNGDFKSLANEIVSVIKDYSSNEEFEEKLLKSDFYNKFKPLQRNYFFWKYENWLRSQPFYAPLSHNDLYNKGKTGFTMEHIVAQKNENEKLRIMCDDIILGIDEPQAIKKFNEKYLHSIANLTLDSRSGNSSQGKKNVEDKMHNYSRAPYRCQTELIDFCEDRNGKKVWTIKSFEEREKRLRAFANNVWLKPEEILNRFN